MSNTNHNKSKDSDGFSERLIEILTKERARGPCTTPVTMDLCNALQAFPELRGHIITLSYGRLAEVNYWVTDDDGTQALWIDLLLNIYVENDCRIDEDKVANMSQQWMKKSSAPLSRFPRPDLESLSTEDFVIVLIAVVMRPIRTRALSYRYATVSADIELRNMTGSAATDESAPNTTEDPDNVRSEARREGAIILVGEIKKFIEKRYGERTKMRLFAMLELRAKATANLINNDEDVAQMCDTTSGSIRSMRNRLKNDILKHFKVCQSPDFDWDKLVFIPPVDPDSFKGDDRN